MRRFLVLFLLLVLVTSGAQAAEQKRITWWGEDLFSLEEEIKQADKIAIVVVEKVTPIGQWYFPDVPAEERFMSDVARRAEFNEALKRNPRILRDELARGPVGWSRIADAHVEEAVAGEFDERMSGLGGMKLGCGMYPSIAGNEVMNVCHGTAHLQENNRYLIMVKPMGAVYGRVGESRKSVNIGYYPIENGFIRGFGSRIRLNDNADAIPLAVALEKIRTIRGASDKSASKNKGIWTPARSQ